MVTILIVEDEDDLRLLLRLSLSGHPFKILEAATGTEAGEWWSSADLVLLDIRLPDTDGLDLLRGIRDRRAPVIAMSADPGRDTRAAAIEAGCVAYLTKPFTLNEFLQTIREHLPLAS